MSQVQINLLTKEFRTSRGSALDKVSRWLVIIGVLGYVGVGTWQYFEYYSATREKASIETDLSSLKTKAVEIEKIKAVDEAVKQQLNNIKTIRSASPAKNEILTSIQAKTPVGLAIQSMNTTKDGLDVRVEAIDFIEVEKFVDSLRQVKIFSAVDLMTLSQDTRPPQANISIKLSKGVQGK